MGDVMILDKKILDFLLKNAEKAYKKGEIPVSAVILDQSGKVISSSFNNRQRKCNILGHAEINAILKAEKKLRDWRLDGYTMVVTLEPCNMCSVIIKECRLDKIYYFLPKKSDVDSWEINIEKEQIKDYKDYTEKFKQLLTDFFNNKR
jgi:tRNA(adenine34) deaminase